MVRLGQRLREIRQYKGLSIDEVAKATKIRAQFISAIERGDYKHLPAKAYAQGFVKIYVAFLGLPQRESLAMFRREFDEREHVDVLPESFTHKKEIPLQHFRWQGAAIITGFVLILVIGYLLFQYRFAFLSPSLIIDSPKENAIVTATDIPVVGTTDTNTTVVVNNDVAYVDSNGHFKKIVAVFSGKATITVTSINKFGKKTTVERHVIVR